MGKIKKKLCKSLLGRARGSICFEFARMARRRARGDPIGS
jgi:hypothetical protein